MVMSTFFKIFPPPKFLNAPYAGISISDDAIQCIQFFSDPHGRFIDKHVNRPLPPGLVEAGHIMDEPKLTEIIKEVVKELGISFVKASLPEEKVYLFKTPVPITKNSTTIDAYLSVLTNAGLSVLSFEMVAQSLGKALIEPDSKRTVLIIHIMNRKAGMYVVHQGVVCFTSTVQLGDDHMADIRKEIVKVYDYWNLHGEGEKEIEVVIPCGKPSIALNLTEDVFPSPVIIETPNVWRNVPLGQRGEEYVPPIPFDDSLDYAVAVGLAQGTPHSS